MPNPPRFATPSIEIEHRPEGTILLRSRQALESHVPHLGLVLRGCVGHRGRGTPLDPRIERFDPAPGQTVRPAGQPTC